MSLEPLIPNRLDDENSALVILDQTLLPNEVVYRALHTTEEICHAIKTLQVRGAPAIGVAAGYGAYLGAKAAPEESFDAFYAYFSAVRDALAASRPTAVNLFWALNRTDKKVLSMKEQPVPAIKAALKEESLAIHREGLQLSADTLSTIIAREEARGPLGADLLAAVRQEHIPIHAILRPFGGYTLLLAVPDGEYEHTLRALHRCAGTEG